jgi:outer membrane protein
MKTRRMLPAALLLSLLTGFPLLADPAVSLQEARTRAVAHSKTLQSQLLSVDSAQLSEKLQRYTMLPSITASTSAGAAVPSSTILNALGISVGVTLAQTVFDGTSGILSAIDALCTSIAREKAREEYFRVLLNADSAFYGLMASEASVEGARVDLENAKTLQALAQARLEAGIISKSDYSKTEAETAAKETALVQAQGKLSVARRTLASLTGLRLPISAAEADAAAGDALMARFAALDDAKIEALTASLKNAAAKSNPSLSQSSLASRQAASQVDLAKAGYLPKVSASWTNSLTYAASAGTPGSAVTISASVPLDLWNTGASVNSKIIAARQASLDAEETQRTLDLQIEGAVFDLVSAAKSVASSRKALEYAEGHYQGVLERYRLSSASALDLSDAALLVSTNRTSLITARYTFLTNISSLRTLAGLESDDLLIAIVP